MARVNARPEWLSPQGAALAALEQAQINGAKIDVLTSAFIEWSIKMTESAKRLEDQASQDTLEDDLAREIITELRAGQAELRQAAEDAIANSNLSKAEADQARADLQELSDRVDAVTVRLAGSKPIPEDQIPPPVDTGGGTDETPGPVPDDQPHPDQTLPGDLPSSRGKH